MTQAKKPRQAKAKKPPTVPPLIPQPFTARLEGDYILKQEQRDELDKILGAKSAELMREIDDLFGLLLQDVAMIDRNSQFKKYVAIFAKIEKSANQLHAELRKIGASPPFRGEPDPPRGPAGFIQVHLHEQLKVLQQEAQHGRDHYARRRKEGRSRKDEPRQRFANSLAARLQAAGIEPTTSINGPFYNVAKICLQASGDVREDLQSWRKNKVNSPDKTILPFIRKAIENLKASLTEE